MADDGRLNLAIYLVNPVILSKKLSRLRIFGEICEICVKKHNVFMQNKANFWAFLWPQNEPNSFYNNAL